MICYRDMCFCTYYKDCARKDECPRPLTPEVQAQAEKWMKNAPIDRFSEKPECFEEMKP